MMRRTTTLIATAALFVAMAPVSPAAAEPTESTVDFGSIGVLNDASPPQTRTEILNSSHLPGDGFRVRDVRVIVESVSHTNPSDIDLGMFIAPINYPTMLMSDAGGDNLNADDNIVGGDFTFDEDAISPPNDSLGLVGGTFFPEDYDFAESDGPDEASGFAPGTPTDLDFLDGTDPVSLRGPWSITAVDDSINFETGSIGSTSVLIRMERPDVDTLVATPNPAQQNEPATVTATATAVGDFCVIDPATGYQFDLDGDGDFADANEGPGTNTRPLNTATSGEREITVRATQTGCPSGGAFRDRSLTFDVEPADPAAPVAVCAGLNATHQGTDAPETIVGTAGNDVIAGLGGGDVILSLGGDDVVCGGDGADLIKGDGGKDKLYGEGGSDVLKGGRDRDLCVGGLGVDRAKKCEKTGSI